VRRILILSGVSVALGLAAVTFLAHGQAGPAGIARAAITGDAPTAGESFVAQLGMPAKEVVVLGASPKEASGEAWAYGRVGDIPASAGGVSYADQLVLLERVGGSGWQIVPLPQGPEGERLSSGADGSAVPYLLGSLGGRVTAAGGLLLLTDGGIVIRDPGMKPSLVKPPAAGVLLGHGETLPPAAPPHGASTPYVALEESNGHTGMLIAPYGDGSSSESSTSESSTSAAPRAGILHYNGEAWQREPIALSSEERSNFTPEAVECGGASAEADASSPNTCWLLAAYRVGSIGEPNRLALFRRTPSTSDPSGFVWEREQVAGWLLGNSSAPPPSVTAPVSVQALNPTAQMLTATTQGVWVDFQAKFGSSPAATDFSELVIPSASQSPPTTSQQPPSTSQQPPTASQASVAGTWCYPQVEAVCSQTLGAALPTAYRSYATPGVSSGDLGKRVITGLTHGAMLEFTGAGGFEYEIGAGGEAGGAAGAALSLSPQGTVQAGWLGDGGTEARDDQGQSQIVEMTSQPETDELQQTPIPFRRPLLAAAQAPGSTPGSTTAEAIAAGVGGEVARYIPAQGWRPETLYNSSGEAQTPTLRGVAWPEPGRAYAVGDNGAMWLWRSDTGLWEPDPATPYNFIGNLNAIAFSPADPSIGYAAGKQGVLLAYGKTWSQVSLPPDLQQANFTSIAFAGEEALATYRTVVTDPRGGELVEVGGVAVEDGSGWHIDSSASMLLGQLPQIKDTVLSKVSGLPDGGAVAAGPGLVIERDSSSSAWRFSAQPLAEAQNISALSAYRDASGLVRAVVSIDLDPRMNPNALLRSGGAFSGDVPPPTSNGQALPHLPPDPLPNTGYVLRETAAGWEDIEHMALPAAGVEDMPVRPDPVLALLVDPSGAFGLAVGGQTDDATGSTPNPDNFETAAAMRFGGDGSFINQDKPTTIVTTPGHATFAVGGVAACKQACADFADEGLAPDTLLSHALGVADQLTSSSPGGLRGFLYTGGRLLEGSSSLGPEVFQRELTRYATVLQSDPGLPVFPAASHLDLAPDGAGIAPFAQTIVPPGVVPGPAGTAAYAFSSTGASGGPVEVIVLDYSGGALGSAQQAWLREQLHVAANAQAPAIVMGNDSLGFTLPEGIGQDPPPAQAQDASQVATILSEGGASAYIFDYPGVNVETQISHGPASIPAFGTGTLGYVSPPAGSQTDSLGSSGFLLLDVNTAARNPLTNVAEVSARVEPNIGELALNATEGLLLRRSQVGFFEGLARIPPSGRAVSNTSNGTVVNAGPEPYEPIPFNCLGADCADQIPTDYTFSSSKPDIGNFVAHEASSFNPRQVELGANNLPVPDSHSGLFCAYNEGTTVVSITAGGLTYSEPVTVQGGSVEYPCGTVPLKNPPAKAEPVSTGFTIPNAAPLAPAPLAPKIQSLTPPAPVPKLPPAHHVTHRHFLPPVPLAPALLFPVLPLLPPPAPNVARPTPPSGTASVSQQVGVAEQEREQQGATEVSHHMVAYRHPEEGPMPAWPAGLIPVAVAAGVGIRRGRGSPEHVLVKASSARRDPRSGGLW
jgi:hypothetical protein